MYVSEFDLKYMVIEQLIAVDGLGTASLEKVMFCGFFTSCMVKWNCEWNAYTRVWDWNMSCTLFYMKMLTLLSTALSCKWAVGCATTVNKLKEVLV